MRALQYIFSSELIEALGWTIVHSIWQVTVVAIGLVILLHFMKKNSAQVKYFLAFVALIIVLIWSSSTFVHSFNYAKDKQEIKENIISNPAYLKTLLADNYSKEKGEIIEEQATFNFQIIKVRSFFQRHFNFICSCWIIGMLFLMIRLSGGYIYTRKLRNVNLSPLPDEWIRKIDEIAIKIGIKRTVSSFFSSLTNTPLTLGIFKPIILFPVTAFTGLSAKQIEAIIAHELAHVLRHDYLFNIIQSLVEILFFYHPAIWIISYHIRKERENSCDNIAIETTGDKVAFVKALAAIQIQSLKNEQLAMTFSPNRNSVLQRIKRLQKQVAMKTNFIEGVIAASVIIMGLTLASFTMGNPVDAPLPKNGKLADSIPAKAIMTDMKKDSIRTEMETKIEKAAKKQKNNEDLEKVVEVALSEQDENLSAEISEEINRAIDEINISEIISEAMKEAAEAIKEASVEVSEAMAEIDHDEINREMREASREIEQAKREMEREMRRDMERDGVDRAIIEASIEAATAGLNVAACVVGNLDIDGIITSALNGVSATLNSLEHYEDDSSEISHNHHNDIDYKSKVKAVEKEKKKLEKEQKQLQKQIDELERRLDKLEE